MRKVCRSKKVKHLTLALSVGVFCVPITKVAAGQGSIHDGVEVGLGMHYSEYDSKGNASSAIGAMGQFGYRFDNPFSLELKYEQADHGPRGAAISDIDTTHTLLNGLYHFHAGARTEPYLGLGVGRYDRETLGIEADGSSAVLSAGLKYHFSHNFLFRPEIFYNTVSGDVDDEFFGVNFIVSAEFGDRAPIAPPSPPKPIDSDNDGVTDSVDKCPDTPPGKTVDAQGCEPPKDSDGDGVTDAKDSCPNTPTGVKVDTQGCEVVPVDTDGDGVYDHVDKCPNTADKLKVDNQGCPKRLMETVSIRLDIKFDSNSAEIKPSHFAEIRKVATFLEQYAGTVVQIEGHTDTLGKASYNKQLSQKRADAVANVLKNEMGVAADRVKAVGFGEENPIADDSTVAGREMNRRVVGEISIDKEKFEQR